MTHPTPASAHPGIHTAHLEVSRPLAATAGSGWFPDISEFNGTVDWGALQAAHQAGTISAVAIRASFGTVRADAQFGRNQHEARARGVPAIYYHFAYPAYNAAADEAAFFNSVVGELQGGEAMCGDFEDDPNARPFPRGAAGLAWCRSFLGALQAPLNATWGYSYPFLVSTVGLQPLWDTWPFWIADYSSTPDGAFGYAITRQFTDAGSTPGVGGRCDQSRVLKGPLSRWLTAAGAPTPMPIPGGGKMTAAHPTIAGRFDAVLLDPSRPGPNGTAAVLHAWSTDNGKTWGYQDWTGPVGYFAPGSESCAWTFDGQLVITGIGGDGAFYLASSDINGPSKGWVRCLPGPFATQAPGATGPIGPPGPTYDDTALRAEVAATDVKAQRALDDLAAIAADAAK